MVQLFGFPGEGRARNIRVPVDERTVRIVLPCPDVQRVKGRQTETIGRIKQMEQLSHQLRRCGILCVPRVRDQQIVSANQLERSVGHRFINYDLRTRDIEDTAADERAVRGSDR